MIMRRLLCAACSALMAALLLTGCGSSAPAQPTQADTASSAAPQEAASLDLEGEKIWSLAGPEVSFFIEHLGEIPLQKMEYTYTGEVPEYYETTDGATVQAVLNAMDQIRIVRETSDYSSDEIHRFAFVASDGTRYCVYFNDRNLESNRKSYLIEHDAALWKEVAKLKKTGTAAPAATASAPAAQTVPAAQEQAPEAPAQENTALENAESSEGAGSIDIYSEKLDLMVYYDPKFDGRVDDNGTINLFLRQEDTLPYIVVSRITNSPSAEEYLRQLGDAIRTEYADSLIVEPTQPSALEVADLDMWGIQSAYQEGESKINLLFIVQNLENEIIIFEAVYEDADSDLAVSTLTTTIDNTYYGDDPQTPEA